MINFSELARLVEKIILVMHDFIKQETHNLSYTKGEICFIALEYFYDGEAIDIGLRVGLQEERVRLQKESNDKNYDIREDGGNFDYYVRILDDERVKPHADAFLMFLKHITMQKIRLHILQ